MTFSGLTLVVRLIVKFSNEIHEFHEIAVPFFFGSYSKRSPPKLISTFEL